MPATEIAQLSFDIDQFFIEIMGRKEAFKSAVAATVDRFFSSLSDDDWERVGGINIRVREYVMPDPELMVGG